MVAQVRGPAGTLGHGSTQVGDGIDDWVDNVALEVGLWDS
jgi:hypothetical protein